MQTSLWLTVITKNVTVLILAFSARIFLEILKERGATASRDSSDPTRVRLSWLDFPNTPFRRYGFRVICSQLFLKQSIKNVNIMFHDFCSGTKQLDYGLRENYLQKLNKDECGLYISYRLTNFSTDPLCNLSIT